MIKLYLNENVPVGIGQGLLLRGYDVITTYDAGNSGYTDRQQMDFATKESRAIFTFNICDFSNIHLEYINRGKRHKGIILSKHIQIGFIIKAISKLLISKTEKDIENNILWLSDFL